MSNEIKLRWLVIEREYGSWNDREDCWSKSFYKDPPVLQFSLNGEEWVNIPTVLEKIKV